MTTLPWLQHLIVVPVLLPLLVGALLIPVNQSRHTLKFAMSLTSSVLLWLVAVRIRDVSFIDAVWPLAMLFLALVTWPRTDGDALRSGLLIGICGLWALRLGLHLRRRRRIDLRRR